MVVLALLVLGLVLAASYVTFATTSLRGTEKLRREGQAKLMLSGRVVMLNGMARSQMESTGLLDLPQIVSSAFPDSGADAQAYTYSATSEGVDLVVATHGLSPLLMSTLDAPDDPFRGALALSANQTVRASATTVASGRRRVDALSTFNLSTIAVRTIPVSQFTLFSRADTLVSASIFTAGDAGRIYSGGDLLIADGVVTTQYPVVAAGQVAAVNEAVINARSNPSDDAPFALRSSTSDKDWPAIAKSIAGSRILSGRDLPLSVMRPAEPQALTATPDSDAPPYPSPDQRLYQLCQRTLSITVLAEADEGGSGRRQYRFRGYAGAMGNNYQGQILSDEGEREMMEACVYNSSNWRGGPVIVFDYSKLRSTDSLYQSYYISVNEPGAIIMVRGARVLQGPLSIVTPHPIVVENGLGDYDTNLVPVTQSQFPVSLVTQDRVYACKSGW